MDKNNPKFMNLVCDVCENRPVSASYRC